MSKHLTRRTFLGYGAGSVLLPGGLLAARKSPNELPNIACVGVGGKGWTDSNGAAAHGNIVAFCDVAKTVNKRRGGWAAAAEKWPKARRYTDWREMLEKEKNIDGLTVTTPDHMHAPVTMTALKQGIACYTQKPLTRTIHESRAIAKAAREAKVATQMGNQHHNGRTYRTLVKMVQGGTIGKIVSAHAWSNRPIWPQGIDRPSGSAKPPAELDWDLWLGVAPVRPFLPDVYHPFKWRGWYDFGAGALGDMGCHIIDPVYWALGLDAPTSIRYEGPPPKKETFPKWERLHYEFPGTELCAENPIKVTWHDGNKQPTPEEANLPGDADIPSNGCIFVGETGVLVTGHGSRNPPELYRDGKKVDENVDIVEGRDHYGDWIEGIKGDGTPATTFDYSGPLCETVLLGCVACRVPEGTLEWNSRDLKFTNSEAANALVRQEYRKGWEVEGL